jgi:tetraacyldisaccharide 4'-kinase
VISVGNITCGGTGKTPTVEMVARDLVERGRKPAILSRGYGQAAVAGDSHTGATRGNDEYRVLAFNLPRVPHYQGKDRYARGVEAIRHGADVLLLDDGFQHARLQRDLDLVLIDAILPFGHGRVLPAGLLREPLGTLARAQLLGVTRSHLVPAAVLEALDAELEARCPATPRMHLRTEALECLTLAGVSEDPSVLKGRRVLAFCGVGNPESFRRQILALGAVPLDVVCFPDHHRYTASDIGDLRTRSSALGADDVVMTQKDAVKLSVTPTTGSWRYLRIAQRIARGADVYRQALDRVLTTG